jgi:hypothetical protein
MLFQDWMKDAQASDSKRIASRPHILVLSPHAGIADGLVRLLRLDGRYDARHVTTLAELAGVDSRWRPDVVLVDGSVLRNARGTLALPVPALLLSGTREDAEQYLPRVPTAKGWLRKDPTFQELESALASAGAVAPSALARPAARLIAMAVFGAVFVLAAIAAIWLALN